MLVKYFSRILFFVFLLAEMQYATGFSTPTTDVYAALQSNDTVKINAQLAALEKSSLAQKDAYIGALTMKLSGLVNSGLKKLSLFKKGRIKLEQSIKLDSLNAEYRFLRLMIQENVPDFLNYHSKKEADAAMIRSAFRKLSPEVQEAIKSYSRKSHVLKPEDFQK